MNIAVRYGTFDDAELIADISRETFFESYAAYNTKENMDKFLNEQFTKGRLMMEVGRHENVFLIAYCNNEVGGYLKLRDDKKPSLLKNNNALEIARIYATAKWKGLGVGKVLMQQAIDIAKEKGKEVLWLIVWSQNEKAIDFYAKWGFKKIDECDFLLGDDVQKDWVMKKVL